MQSQQWIKSVNLSRNQTQLTYFASLSLKAGEFRTFLRKDEILELPRQQNTSKMFSVVPTTRNNLPQPQGYAGKMNSHVVLIMRSSMLIRSRSPQSPYLKLPIVIYKGGKRFLTRLKNIYFLTHFFSYQHSYLYQN